LSVTEHHIKNNFFEKNNAKLINRSFFGTLRLDVVDRLNVTRENPIIERPIFISYADIKLERTLSTTSIRVRDSTATMRECINTFSRTPQIKVNLQQSAHVSVN
jgi:hypothetical protein